MGETGDRDRLFLMLETEFTLGKKANLSLKRSVNHIAVNTLTESSFGFFPAREFLQWSNRTAGGIAKASKINR